jgi:hypothetical protein
MYSGGPSHDCLIQRARRPAADFAAGESAIAAVLRKEKATRRGFAQSWATVQGSIVETAALNSFCKRQGNPMWKLGRNSCAPYPHPCPLPTRGRETPSRPLRPNPPKFGATDTTAKSPSPLWGGVGVFKGSPVRSCIADVDGCLPDAPGNCGPPARTYPIANRPRSARPLSRRSSVSANWCCRR